ncbi:winged helix-turn-helix transcriptional regulator [Candidatus Woesearchaeota archaeon]|nr:winged helix-turn-helix transcriptional regulator [Candidatus Woesearchaeota archaeon]
MELGKVFLESRWKLLNELSDKPLSPTELSKKIGSTIANVSTQLRLLEALDFITKSREKSYSVGKPAVLYSLKKEFAYLTIVSNSLVGKRLIKLDYFHNIVLNIWFINDYKVHYYLQKFFFQFEHILTGCDAFGYLDMNPTELEILILCSNPNEHQNLFADARIEKQGEEAKKIKASIHSIEDIKRGLENRDKYFTSLINQVVILRDIKGDLIKIKKEGI